MIAIQDFEAHLLELPVRERADLASRLLASLPPCLADEDEGVVEAFRRKAEAEQDPTVCLSIEEFTNGITALRSK